MFSKNKIILIGISIIAFIIAVIYSIGVIKSYSRAIVYERELEKLVKDSLYVNLKRELTDSINSYARQNIFMFTRFNECKWKLDTLVLFNRQRDRAILFILVSSLNTDYYFDQTNQVYAKFQNGRWKYYFAGQLSHSTVHMEELNTNEKVLEYLSEEVKMLATSGYFRVFEENRYEEIDSVELRNQEFLEEHYFNRKREDFE